MQGYTYTKGEHYPVEHLVFKVAPPYLSVMSTSQHKEEVLQMIEYLFR